MQSTEDINGYDPEQDATYMSPAMLSFFEKKLKVLQIETIEKEQDISHSLVDNPNREADMVDQGAQEGQYYTDFMLQEHEDHLRVATEKALERIRQGTYGYCEVTSEPIGVKRLLIVPTAKYCIKVQEEREAKNKP